VSYGGDGFMVSLRYGFMVSSKLFDNHGEAKTVKP